MTQQSESRPRGQYSQRASAPMSAFGMPQETTGRGRKRGTMDAGTVALAMGAMSFYWTMPMLLSRSGGRRRRRPRTDAAQAVTTDAAVQDTPIADTPLSEAATGPGADAETEPTADQ